jgi:hypothetical protein
MSDNNKPFPVFHFEGEDYPLLQHFGGTKYAIAGHTTQSDFETRLGLVVYASRDDGEGPNYSSSASYVLNKYGKTKLRIKFNLLGKMYNEKSPLGSIAPLKLTVGEFRTILYTVLSVCKDHHEILEGIVEASSNGELSENKLLSASSLLKEYHNVISQYVR